jgi:hypothetical protein
MTDDARQQEIDRNYEEFRKMLPTIIEAHRNKYALMRHGAIVNYYTTAQDARTTAEKFYEDGLYSIQKVSDAPIDLGFFSHAVHLGHV